MLVSTSDFTARIKSDPKIGASIFALGGMGVALGHYLQYAHNSKIKFLDGVIYPKRSTVGRKDLADAWRYSEFCFRTDFKREKTAANALLQLDQIEEKARSNIMAKCNALTRCEHILDEIKTENTFPVWKRFFRSPRALKTCGTAFVTLGLGLALYEGYNALRQDGAEHGSAYRFGRNTVRFTGAALGSLAGGIIGAPLTFVGSLVCGEFLARKGEDIADHLYGTKWNAPYQVAFPKFNRT